MSDRAARYCNGAAHGGQIVCPLDIVVQLIELWTGEECPQMPTDGCPLILTVGLLVIINHYIL